MTERASQLSNLEKLLAVAGQQAARLVVFAAPITCPCPDSSGVSLGGYRVRAIEGACPLQGTGATVGAAGVVDFAPKLCIQSDRPSETVYALQLGVEGARALADASMYGQLVMPSVLRSQDGPDKPILEDPAHHMVTGAPEASSGQAIEQALIYARETQQLFLQVRQLRQELTVLTAQGRREIGKAIASLDEEREWIALEVHDRIAQNLASVFHLLQAIIGMSRAQSDIRQAALRAALLCRELIQESRNIMNELRPPVLEDLGVIPAIQEQLGRFAVETSCQILQVLDVEHRPSRNVEITIYRILVEALINIRKHARATEVRVSLKEEDGGVRLEVRDNGVGFDVEKALALDRVGGLLSMRRRAEFCGGTLELESTPANGSRVSLWVPL